MKRTTRDRLALISVVLLLLAAVTWQWRHDRAGHRETLLSLDSAAVTRIDVLRRGQPAQHYIKRHTHWWRKGPRVRRVDDARLQDLAAAGLARVLHWRSASDFKLALIGLAPPALVLVLNGHRLAFGATAATGPQRYVQVGQRIALIPAVDAPHPPSPDTAQKSLRGLNE